MQQFFKHDYFSHEFLDEVLDEVLGDIWDEFSMTNVLRTHDPLTYFESDSESIISASFTSGFDQLKVRR